MQDEIEKIIDFKNIYQMMLYEPNLLLQHRKECKSFLMGVRLYNLIKTSGFNKDLSRSYIKQIRLYDENLATQISMVLPQIDDKPIAFADLFNAYTRGRDYFVAYVTSNIDGLIARARSISDEKTSRKLVRLFSAVSGQELKYLNRYRQDCDNWSNPKYAINYGVGFFIRRLNLYVKGGYEENIKFVGLYKDFHDEKLTREILANSAVRNLWRYAEQVNYLTALIGVCIEAQKSGEWKGFYGKNGLSINGIQVKPFWANFKEHAEAFTSKYGNSEFTAELKSKKDKIGESPISWGGIWQVSNVQDTEKLRLSRQTYIVIGGAVFIMSQDGILPQLLRKLQNPDYHRRRIIFPASVELHTMFTAKEEILRTGGERSINELLGILRELAGYSVDKNKLFSKLKRILRRKKSKVIKNISSDANELFNKARQPLLNCLSYSETLDAMVELINPDHIKERLQALYALSRNSLWIAGQQLSRADAIRSLLIDWRNFVQVDGTLGAAKTAKIERRRLIFDEHLSLNDLKRFQQLIRSAPTVLQALRILEYYIKSKIENLYLIGMKDLGTLSINEVQNENMEIGFIKSQFDRLI